MDWQPIETAPQDESILAALLVRNRRTRHEWWEMHLVVIDSDTAEISAETDAGWSAGDYTHWMPLPSPPGAA